MFIDKQKGLMKRISASDYSEERVVQNLIINYPDLHSLIARLVNAKNQTSPRTKLATHPTTKLRRSINSLAPLFC